MDGGHGRWRVCAALARLAAAAAFRWVALVQVTSPLSCLAQFLGGPGKPGRVEVISPVDGLAHHP